MRQCHEICYGKDTAEVADEVLELGETYHTMDRDAVALEHFERAELIYKRFHMTVSNKFATLLFTKGTILATMGSFKLALGVHRESLAISRKLLPPDHPHNTHSLRHGGRNTGVFRPSQ